jgi:hypothetical protein
MANFADTDRRLTLIFYRQTNVPGCLHGYGLRQANYQLVRYISDPDNISYMEPVSPEYGVDSTADPNQQWIGAAKSEQSGFVEHIEIIDGSEFGDAVAVD